MSRFILRWTSTKPLVAFMLYLSSALFIEYFLFLLFIPYGLSEKALLTWSFKIPLTEFICTISISLIFHLIPLGVTITLVSSWMHLTSFLSKGFQKRKVTPKLVAKKIKVKKRRRRLSAIDRKIRPIRRFFRRVSWKLKVIRDHLNKTLIRLAETLRINYIRSVLERRPFARASIKGALIVLSVFLVFVTALYLAGYPSLIYKGVVSFYQSNPSFYGFVLETFKFSQSIVQSSGPFRWLTLSINNALIAAALGFRGTLENSFGFLIENIVGLDAVWKYVLCQNVAAWGSALSVLLCEYLSR